MNNILKYYLCILLFTTLHSANVVAAIASLKGDVKIRQMESAKYASAYKGQMIESGNWIKTGDDVFLAVIFLDGTNVKIHQKTEIEITSSRLTAKELKTNMYIAEGEAWSDVNKQGNGSFKIETPTAVASVKGTEFDVVYDFNSGSTMLKVISGEVEFGNDNIGNILANAMEGSEINKDTKEPSKYKITENDIMIGDKDTDMIAAKKAGIKKRFLINENPQGPYTNQFNNHNSLYKYLLESTF